MRIIGILAVVTMVGLAAFQSILGGAPDSRAQSEHIVLAQADICPVEAIKLPVIERKTRQFTMIPPHKALTVTPARYGTKVEEVVIVPEHHEGATFFTDRKRVIISEATRRLRVMGPEFETVPAIATSVKRARVSGGILIEDTAPLNTGPETKIVLREAQIQAVRINAGLKMLDVKSIDMDGDGDLIPAQTMSIEVRTVDSHPAVASSEIAAVVESHEIERLKTPAATVEVDAVCSMAGRSDLIADVQQSLEIKGYSGGVSGVWSPATIDAMAAVQAEETGLVSPYLLIETLRKWMPEVTIPTS